MISFQIIKPHLYDISDNNCQVSKVVDKQKAILQVYRLC